MEPSQTRLRWGFNRFFSCFLLKQDVWVVLLLVPPLFWFVWFVLGEKKKVARDMEQAADCFERAAEQYVITKSAHESAKCYVEAAKCRKGAKPDSAVDSFRKVYHISCVNGVLFVYVVVFVSCHPSAEIIACFC